MEKSITPVMKLLNTRSKELDKIYKEIHGTDFTRLAVVGAQIAEVDHIKNLIKEKLLTGKLPKVKK